MHQVDALVLLSPPIATSPLLINPYKFSTFAYPPLSWGGEIVIRWELDLLKGIGFGFLDLIYM